MAYTCRLYKNTGFNKENQPDSAAVLELATDYTDAAALEITQGWGHSTLKVATTQDVAQDVDYIRLVNDSDLTDVWYYSAAPAYMDATDVAVFAVALAPTLTGGGVSALNILDGITDRVHVAEDNYGEWDEDDPLLNPAQPLELNGAWINPSEQASGESGDYVPVVSCTVNPKVTADLQAASVYTYIDGDGVTHEVNIPRVFYNDKLTNYTLDGSGAANSDGTTLFLADAEDLAALRAVAAESAIINQVIYAWPFITLTTSSNNEYSFTDGAGTAHSTTYTYVATVNSEKVELTLAGTAASFVNTDAVNNRINYSNITKYGMLSCSGESAESDPATLYMDGETAPSVVSYSDPHPDGKPYYRFKYINGEEATGAAFFRNCIGGMKWKQVPLVFTQASGSALNTMRFGMQQEIAAGQQESIRESYNQARQNIVTGAIGQGVQAAAGIAAAASMIGAAPITGGATLAGLPGAISTVAQAAGGIANLAQSSYQLDRTQAIQEANYELNRKADMQEYIAQQTVVTPTVIFPFNTEVLRDFYGNGLYAYRYSYTAEDVTRIDRLLTMYGYKVTKALETSDFTNRQYFNYVRCGNVSVTGHSKWLNERIGDELRGGVRFWHVLPDNSYYTNNPITTAEETA